MKKSGSFQTRVILSEETFSELSWWENNLVSYNGRQVIQWRSRLRVQTDASKRGWGTSFQRIRTGGLRNSGTPEYIPGTDSHKLWSESGSQCQTKPSLSCSGGQYFSPDISDKNGRGSKSPGFTASKYRLHRQNRRLRKVQL